jgi:UPF0755 protein
MKLKVATIILAVVVFLFLATGTGFVLWYKAMLQPLKPDCSNCQKSLVVASGQAVSDVATSLETEGLIKNALAFRVYWQINGSADGIQAGTYELSPAQDAKDITKVLMGKPNGVFRVTFLPGGTLADAKKTLLGLGYTAEEVDAAFTKAYDHPVLAGKPAKADLEGYIYGETYEFYKNAQIEDIVKRCLDELWDVVQHDDLVAKFQRQGLNLYQGITLASIVQRESGNAKDQPGIARVFLNRLAEDMTLGSDVTYQYAADKLGVERNPELESPYNTRLHTGLPPGPISAPGQSALHAVGNPSNSQYLFFLSGDDNKIYYGTTNSEHEQNIQNHCAKKCQIL